MAVLLVILLLIVIASIVVLLINKDEKPAREAPPATGGVIMHKTPVKVPDNQITICSHHADRVVRLCPVCDGENPPSAANCHICGQQLH